MSLKEILLVMLAVSLGCLIVLVLVLYFDSEESRIEKQREEHKIAQQILYQAENRNKSKQSSNGQRTRVVNDGVISTSEKDINNTNKGNDSNQKSASQSSKKVFVADKKYNVEHGQTFYMDKGLLKLYAKLDLIDNVLLVNGEEYHNGGQLTDGTIDEEFYFDPESNQFINSSKTITISDYDGMQFKIEDKRTGICLPFNGTLSLIGY